MIVLLGKNLRKWLLGLAVATRNRVQVIVARLEPAEEGKAEQAGPEITAQGAKTALPGGPPDHWVQLVKRHAPELLQGGFPYAVPGAPSPVFEGDAAMDEDESVPEAAHDLKPDSGAPDDEDAPTRGDLTHSSSSPRAPKAYEGPGRRQPSPDQDGQGQAGDDFRITGAVEHSRQEAATRVTGATRSGSDRTGRPSVSPAGADSTFGRRISGRKRHEKSVPDEGPGTGPREAETPAAESRSKPTKGQIENARAGAGERKNMLATEQTGRRGGQDYPKASEHQAGLRVNTRMPVLRELNQDAGDNTQPGPGDATKGMASSPGTGGKTPVSQIKSGGDDFRPVVEIGIVNGRRSASAPQDREKVAEKTSPPSELSWPSLPGEKDSDDVRNPHLSATWPALPAEHPAEVTSSSNQVTPHPTEAESRNMERLRRLDEEQKGRPWSESHF